MTADVNEYQKADILGKSQLELIIQVYDGAIAAFNAASEAYRGDDNSGGYEHLEKAKRFVTHLYTTLDAERGGEIAERLGKLYAFVINQTTSIQATKDLKQIDDNITILANLRSAWVELKDREKETSPSEPESSGSDNERAIVTSA